MALRVDAGVLPELRRFGAFDINACFNCGNCTAVCPLSEGTEAFPRRVIRYAQLGQRASIAASKEVWLCYYCGECSLTCPRQAEPGEFMASARRYAIAGFDPTGFARRMYSSKAFAAGAAVVLFAALVAVFLGTSPGLPSGRVDTASLLRFVPYELIHWLGLGVVAFVALATVATLVNMVWMLARAPVPGAPLPDQRAGRFPLSHALRSLGSMLREVLAQRRYRDCDTESDEPHQPLPLRRWFVHYSVMGGMVGLALATALDYFVKKPGSYVPLYYPIRLLGIIAGVFLLFGTSVAIVQRLRKKTKYYSHTTQSDWIFLGLLWLIGVTGFVLTLGEYVTLRGTWMDVVFVFHVGLAMELIVLLPFTKLAHVVYRPVALWLADFRRLRAVAR
jgi:nitrate reductase gamma subunit/ferredoxin